MFSFDVNDDYVYDAKWHPTNASLFASCGANGRLDLWDLNKDTEMPMTNFDLGKNVLNKMSSGTKKKCEKFFIGEGLLNKNKYNKNIPYD